ncbi:MAG: PH domain-containing protein [Ruminococcus sp.]|nr:PH domain-containing protein [Ruminococcus sp.]
MKLKPSFVYVVFFLYRFGFLLAVIPLQRVIFEKLPPKIAIYIYRSDICALFLLCVWAILSLHHIYAYTENSTIHIRKGIFIARELVFKKKTIHTTHLSQGIFLRFCKACKAEVFSSKASASIYLKAKDCRQLLLKNGTSSFKNGLFSSIIFSVSFSSSLTGLLSLVPLLRNIASILGEKQTQSILSYADLWQAIGYTAAPPFLRIVSSLIFFSWATGAAVEFFRYYRLRLTRGYDSVLLEHGLIKHHTKKINKKAISALVKRQSILLYFSGLFTLEAYVSHSKQYKIPLLLASRKSRCQGIAKNLGFSCTDNFESIVKPHTSALWGYTWKPLLFISLLSLAFILTDTLTPFRTEPHLALFLTLWGVVWFMFSTVAHSRSALLCKNDSILIRSTRGLSYIEAVIPSSKITCIRTTQNIFQKRKGLCHLYVHIPSSKRQYFLIRHIDKSKTAQLTKA